MLTDTIVVVPGVVVRQKKEGAGRARKNERLGLHGSCVPVIMVVKSPPELDAVL